MQTSNEQCIRGTVGARKTTLFRTIRKIKCILVVRYESTWASNARHYSLDRERYILVVKLSLQSKTLQLEPGKSTIFSICTDVNEFLFMYKPGHTR